MTDNPESLGFRFAHRPPRFKNDWLKILVSNV